MSDATGPSDQDTQHVFRLIYRSHSLIAPDQRRTELGAIFTTARQTNRRLGITGALMISEDAFVQTLEGEESAVRELYASIAQDPRHDHVTILEEQTAVERTFGRWAMAKVSEDDGPDIRLLSNARKGVIVLAPGQDQTVTAAQETVLALMRKSLAMDTLAT